MALNSSKVFSFIPLYFFFIIIFIISINIVLVPARLIKGYKGIDHTLLKKGDCKFSLEILHLQDSSEDFDIALHNIIEQFENLVTEVDSLHSNNESGIGNSGTSFGLASFNDKPFNEAHDGHDVCLESLAPIGSSKEEISAKLKELHAQGGNDVGENYLGAMIRAALSMKTRWTRSGYKSIKKEEEQQQLAVRKRFLKKNNNNKTASTKSQKKFKVHVRSAVTANNETGIPSVKESKRTTNSQNGRWQIRESVKPPKSGKRVPTVKLVIVGSNSFAHWSPLFGRDYQMSIWSDVTKNNNSFGHILAHHKKTLHKDANAFCREVDYPSLTNWGEVLRQERVIPLILATDWTDRELDYEVLDISTKLGEEAWMHPSTGLVSHWESLLDWANLDGMVAPVDYEMKNFTEAIMKELKYSLPQLVC